MKRLLLVLPLLLGLPACSKPNALDVTCTGEMKRMEYNEPDDNMTFVERFVISDKYELASYYQRDGFDEWKDPGTAEYKESPDSFVITHESSMYVAKTTVNINKKDPSIASIFDQGPDSIVYESYSCISNQ